MKICLILVFGILLECMMVQSTDYHGKSSQSSKDDEGHGNSAPANYQFQYAVNEGGSGNGNDFGHEETRNGQTTRGQYKVLLPDGRMQVVTYTADENGYRAQVTYENVGGGYSAPQPAPSYGPPPQQPSAADSGHGYAASQPAPVATSASSFGQRTSGRSFVKLRSSIGGNNHKYNYNL